MAADLAVMTGVMHGYFEKCTADAKNKYVAKKDKEIASIAGLCVKLSISKAKLLSMAQGAADDKKFYDEMLLDYEVCGDAMYASSMIDSTAYKAIKEFCQASGTASDKMIVLEFPNWNAPDDWEEYKLLRKACDEQAVTWKQAILIIKRAGERS